jgi:hypothetical protein
MTPFPRPYRDRKRPTTSRAAPRSHSYHAPPGTRASKWPHDHSGHPRLHPRTLHLRRLFSARPTLNTFLPSPHSLLPRFPPHTTEHNHRLGAASIALLDSALPADGYALPSFVAPRRNTSPTRSPTFPTPRSALFPIASERSYSWPAAQSQTCHLASRAPRIHPEHRTPAVDSLHPSSSAARARILSGPRHSSCLQSRKMSNPKKETFAYLP